MRQRHRSIRLARWLFACVLHLVLLGCETTPVPHACDTPQTDPVGDVDVTLEQLLREMTNPLPPSGPAFVAAMASSHNRLSTDPDDHGNWHANRDRGHYVRSEGDEHVLFEAEGPGVITRVWSANPSGTLRVYIDDVVVLEGSMRDLLGGRVAPFTPPWAQVAGLGANFYFPIPYQGACRITSTATEGLFYQVSYRAYVDPEVTVESFTRARADAAVCAQAEVATQLTQAAGDATQPSGSHAEQRSESVLPGQRIAVAVVADAEDRAVTEVRVVDPQVEPEALRQLWLVAEFDGTETLKVPLADFFGSGPGVNAVQSLVSRVDVGGDWVATWPMPFRDTATLSIHNHGTTAIDLAFSVTTTPFSAPDADYYFHASWHAPETISTARRSDWPAARISGRGALVGSVLNVVNPSPAWWGEGDERIYVDGETTPSFAGTGTEDFFGYAWCTTQLFSTAYIGQTRATERSNWGRISMYRWLIADPIPFNESLAFDWEITHWREGVDGVEVSYDALFYWYGDLASTDALAASPEDLDVSVLVPPLEGDEPETDRPAGTNYRCY